MLFVLVGEVKNERNSEKYSSQEYMIKITGLMFHSVKLEFIVSVS